MSSQRKSRRRKKNAGGGAYIVLLLIAAGLGLVLYERNTQQPVHHRQPVAVSLPTPTPIGQSSATPVPVAASATPAVVTSRRPEASSAPAAESGAKLAIIIDDCGQWIDTERALIALPIPLTVSVLPHVRYTGTIAQEAADAHQGVMLHLPMEPISHIDPGPGEIKTTMSDDQIAAQLRDDLAQVPLARGVNNHEGSEATADPRVMREVASVIAQQGSDFFIDSRTAANSVAAQITTEAGIPTASRDVFLDNTANVAQIEGMLAQAGQIALRNGSAIAIGHPRPTTLAALTAMIPKLESQGISFTLVENLVGAKRQ
ncbi:MAG: divergent polysaccharide deacetylase family protein [Candidatus Baltobacteraceae bacterium]